MRKGISESPKEQAKLIGRIIFANLLELSLTKYKDFIDTVTDSLLFDKLLIKQKRLSRATVAVVPPPDSIRGLSGRGLIRGSLRPGVIAKIAKSSKIFSIRYTYEGFNIRYGVDTKKFLECINYFDAREEAGRFFHKLRRISSRNELTHRVIRGIIKHQWKYLMTGDPGDLVALSQVKLAEGIGAYSHWSRIDKSWVSRLVKGISVITPSGEEKPLRWFFQTQKDINKRLIKRLLDRENEDIESGKLSSVSPVRERFSKEAGWVDKENIALYKKMIGLTDNQIRAILERRYGLSLSRWSVALCRRDMGIPPAKRRLSGYKYPPLSANFSLLYSLTIEAVQSNAPASPGVYEFRLNGKEVEYPQGKTNVIYIGRTMNIKKRLREHLGRQGKNRHIRSFLKRDKCLFRYILFKRDWEEEEKRLYKLFIDTYGSAPKCNRVKP